MELFGPYRIEGLLGRGGMGEVHRAFDAEHQRDVALKRLSGALAGDDVVERRFRREAAVVARLREPHVVPIHRFGEIDGRLYIDMRLVEGRDLAKVLAQDGPLAPARAAAVITQVAAALDAAHADGLVHRDVKPSNILLSPDDTVTVVDFGVAALASGTALTKTGETVGTPAYTAPEQFYGPSLDHRADVYSLACVLFQCVTGRKPFAVRTVADAVTAHLMFPPPDGAGALDPVVARGMAKEPADRYPSAGALAAAAREATLQASARPDPIPPHGGRSGRRRGLLVAGVIAAVAVLIAGVAALATALSRPVAAAVAGSAPDAVRSRVTVGGDPSALAVSPDGSRAYVVNTGSATVTLIDVAHAAVTGTVTVPGDPRSAVVDRAGTLWVSSFAGDAVTRVDPAGAGRAVGSTKVDLPTSVAYLPGVDRIVTTDGLDDQGYVLIDPATGSVTGRLGTTAVSLPGAMAASPDGSRLYVADPSGRAVVAVDTADGTVLGRVPVGDRPDAVVAAPDGRRVYVSSSGRSTISVIDPVALAVTSTIATTDRATGSGPGGIALSPDGSRLYASGTSGVTVVDTVTGRVVSTLGTGVGVTSLAVSPDGRTLYGVDSYRHELVVIGT